MTGKAIDFHTHILPGIDDGSKSTEMSLEMLAAEREQGVQAVVLTPHFYADRDPIDRFLERREKSLGHLKNAAANGGYPVLIMGAEVCFFRGMSEAEKLTELTIAGTQAILVEMPFRQWEERDAKEIEEMIRGRGLNVVLAHIERYIKYQKDRSVWDRVMDLPLATQINCGSFLKDMRKRRFCTKWICCEAGSAGGPLGSVIGSDCHNTRSRVPNIADARAVIEKKAGSEVLARMDGLAAELLGI